MKLTSETIETARFYLFGLTALILLVYAALALLQGTPQPFYWWAAGAMGFSSMLLLVSLSILAGKQAAKQAWDEHYQATSRNAAARAFWIAMGLFVLTCLLPPLGLADRATSTAVFGTLMGASFLLSVVYDEWRAGR
ncbi:MAG: hypothetical protein KIH71_003705 [Roseobacter sp.]|nr:hypothetical protein [Roseobacter sp.]